MLLSASEITVDTLMADLPIRRATRHQLQMLLIGLEEGLTLPQNSLEREGPIKQHMVGEGETLQIISVRLFQSAQYWRAIAELNNLQYPYAVYPGMVLKVPEINGHQ
jgi:nucleoid-associated protein YgaU